MSPLNVVAVLFPNLTGLDFAGPAQVFSAAPSFALTAVSAQGEAVTTDAGFGIVPRGGFAEAPQADVLLVPGGEGVNAAMVDPVVLDFVRRQAATAKVVASVCSGALVLGAAGLLKGRRATTHWASLQFLGEFGAIAVHQRTVEDGPVVTSGGVSAGIDLALWLVERLAGDEEARQVQLGIEYDPQPRFTTGNPVAAPREWVEEGESRQRATRGWAVAEAAGRLG